MTNSVLTIDTIATAAVAILDNELVAAKQVYRGLESEFSDKVNGFEKGDTVSMRRPTDFTVRDGAVAVNQDIVEGKVALTVDKQKGIDFGFTSKELTLSIGELSERVIKPAMVQLANQIDRDVLDLYKQVPNWVGTPGQKVNSYGDFALAPERLDEFGVPSSDRSSILSPADHWGLLGSQTSLYIQDAAKGAYRNGSLGMIGGVDTYMAQNVPTHTVGVWAGTTIAVDGAVTASSVSYANVKDTMLQTITIDGFTAAAPAVAVGDVFEITDVNAVNPVTKAPLPFRKQFTVIATANASGNQVDVTFYPAMIWSGAFQNVAVKAGVSDLDGKVIVPIGTDSTGYRQNMVFHKNAFALAMVPLISPPGASQVSRKNYKGTSVRLIPTYDGTNDKSNYRLDVLYGVKAIDPRLAVRLSGSA
jgi:ribosomal 50S subunit-recycling heat shock protein